MKCRSVYTEEKNGKYKHSLVFFGSAGKDDNGNKIPAENYSTESKGVAASLIQRLSVIKGELWYKASYGLPLMDKIRNKGIYDSIIINIITSHPDVVNIVYYDSEIKDKNYIFDFIVYTVYNEEVRIQHTI